MLALKERTMLITIVCLIAWLHQTTGQAPSFYSLVTSSITVQNAIVDVHNGLRRQVIPTASNMLKMRWNATLAKNAQLWADACNQDHSPENKRQINGFTSGENLYMSSSPNSWTTAIEQAWYGEEKDFEYEKGARKPGAVIGHYTQVVWYKSSEVGCAVSYCPKLKYPYFMVCQYFPPGNVASQINKPYKKGPPCGDCPRNCDDSLCTNPCSYYDIISNCADLKPKNGPCSSAIEPFCPATCKCTTEIK